MWKAYAWRYLTGKYFLEDKDFRQKFDSASKKRFEDILINTAKFVGDPRVFFLIAENIDTLEKNKLEDLWLFDSLLEVKKHNAKLYQEAILRKNNKNDNFREI